MNISLRRGERFFVNGAVLRVDRRVCIELMNDVTFLLEQHIMQPDQARSPLQQLYLAIQTIIISPETNDQSTQLALAMIQSQLMMTEDLDFCTYLLRIRTYLEKQKPFEALKSLGDIFHREKKDRLNIDHTQRSINLRG